VAGLGICPWWVGYFLASPLRRLAVDPGHLLAPFVHAGMTVLEPGPGLGFFTLEMARRVGPAGRIIAVDVEPRMIKGLQRRARKAGRKRELTTTFPGSPVTTRLPIDTVGDGKNERDVVRGS